MENIKLFELLSTFSKDEFIEFGLFIDSPFHNSSKQAKQLYQIIKKHFPKLSHQELTRENIFRKFYPGEEYKDKKIRDLFSITNKLAEEFLGYNYAKREEFFLRRGALREMAKRDLSKHFEQKKRETESELEKLPVKDDHYFYYNNRLLYDTRTYYVTKRTIPKSESLYKGMEQEIEQFVLYFVSKMLYYYTYQLNQLVLVKHETTLMLIDELMSYLTEQNIDKYPHVKVLFFVVLLLTNKNDKKAMEVLESILSKNDLPISSDLLRDAFTILFNCNKELAIKGDEYYNAQSHVILKKMVEKNVLPIENGYVDVQGFLTYFRESLVHKDYDWAQKFIEEFHTKLRPEFRDNIYSFTLGQLEYRKGNYDNALALFSKVNAEDFNIYVVVKMDTIRICFEAEEFDRAVNEIDSFRHHLNNNSQLNEIFRRRYSAFASNMSKAVTCLLKDDFESLFFLKKDIEAAPVFENRKWMIAQLTEILEKQKHKK